MRLLCCQDLQHQFITRLRLMILRGSIISPRNLSILFTGRYPLHSPKRIRTTLLVVLVHTRLLSHISFSGHGSTGSLHKRSRELRFSFGTYQNLSSRGKTIWMFMDESGVFGDRMARVIIPWFFFGLVRLIRVPNTYFSFFCS